MILIIEILLIVALAQANVLLFKRTKPVITEVMQDLKETVTGESEPIGVYAQILKNIDSYDGSGRGQVRVDG